MCAPAVYHTIHISGLRASCSGSGSGSGGGGESVGCPARGRRAAAAVAVGVIFGFGPACSISCLLRVYPLLSLFLISQLTRLGRVHGARVIDGGEGVTHAVLRSVRRLPASRKCHRCATEAKHMSSYPRVCLRASEWGNIERRRKGGRRANRLLLYDAARVLLALELFSWGTECGCDPRGGHTQRSWKSRLETHRTQSSAAGVAPPPASVRDGNHYRDGDCELQLIITLLRTTTCACEAHSRTHTDRQTDRQADGGWGRWEHRSWMDVRVRHEGAANTA